MLAFLWASDVDATNWRAEHAIRPAVVNRKICGGNRTPRGARTQEIRFLSGIGAALAGSMANKSSIVIDLRGWRTPSDGVGAGPLPALQDAVRPRETRVYLPTQRDGAAEVSVGAYDAIAEVAKWARLPTDVAGRGKSGEAQGAQPRHVHAKVYRLWRKGGPDPGQRPRETEPFDGADEPA